LDKRIFILNNSQIDAHTDEILGFLSELSASIREFELETGLFVSSNLSISPEVRAGGQGFGYLRSDSFIGGRPNFLDTLDFSSNLAVVSPASDSVAPGVLEDMMLKFARLDPDDTDPYVLIDGVRSFRSGKPDVDAAAEEKVDAAEVTPESLGMPEELFYLLGNMGIDPRSASKVASFTVPAVDATADRLLALLNKLTQPGATLSDLASTLRPEPTEDNLGEILARYLGNALTTGRG
jgi:hypothetical protein